MNLPRGNVLLKPTALELEELRIKLTNLQHHEFNGYMVANRAGSSFYVFLRQGKIESVVEFSNEAGVLISEILLYHRLCKSESSIASYVLAPDLVDILSKSYAFQEMHRNFPLSQKDLSKLLSSLETDKVTGMLELQDSSGGDSKYLLFREGVIATDGFQDFYGQILTAPAKISEVLESFSMQGGVISFFGETPKRIISKEKEMTETLSQYKELTVSVDSSGFLFGGSNLVRVDEALLREWSQTNAIQRVEIFFGAGVSEIFKVNTKKGFGNKISVSSAVQKKFGLSKDESVLVKPAL